MKTGSEVVSAPAASDLTRLASETREFLSAAKAESTRRAYRTDWLHFAAWCRRHTLDALPATPETVALYLTDLAASHKPRKAAAGLTLSGCKTGRDGIQSSDPATRATVGFCGPLVVSNPPGFSRVARQLA